MWDEIKAGTYKGFSVEIFYTLVPMARQEEPDRPLLDRIFDKIQNRMSFERFKERLAAILAEPEQTTEEPAKMGSVTTDKGVVAWDGDEDLKAGDRVQVEDADGNRTEAPDGDYTTGDGKVIVVVDGKVAEIRDPEAEVAPEEEPAQESDAERFAAVAATKMASYGEKFQAIAEALAAALGDKPFYLVDAGDDFAIVCVWEEDRETLYRYDVSWDGETASVSNPVEVKMAYVPVREDTSAEEEQMEAALSAAETFKAENATLRARIAELEARPAGTPAHESFRGEGPQGSAPGKTGNKGLDRLAALMGA